MSLQRSCCCGAADCTSSSVTWGCSQSRTQWTTSTSGLAEFECDVSSTQTFGFGNCSRTRDIYMTGSITPSTASVPQFEAINTVEGTVGFNTHSQLDRNSTAYITDGNSADFVSSTQVMQFDAEWTRNRWYSGFQTGCTPAGPPCTTGECDVEVVQENRIIVRPITGQDPENIQTVPAEVYYSKDHFSPDPTGGGITAGCMTRFGVYALCRKYSYLQEKRERSYMSGIGQIADTGWTTVYSGDWYGAEESNFFREGNQQACDSFKQLAGSRWVPTDGTTNRFLEGLPGFFPAGPAGAASFRELMHYAIDRMHNGDTLSWSPIKYDSGTTIQYWHDVLGVDYYGLPTSAFPIQLPYQQAQTLTSSGPYSTGWTINSMEYNFEADANHYGVT